MNIGIILGIIGIITVFGVVFFFEPNNISNSEEVTTTQTIDKIQPKINMKEVEQMFQQGESEEEIIKMVTEIMTSPSALQECAELYEKVELSIKTADFQNPESIKESIKIQKDFTETLCLSVKDQWYNP